MKSNEKNLWSGKTEVEPNIWGMNAVNGQRGFSLIGGGGMLKNRDGSLMSVFIFGSLLWLGGMLALVRYSIVLAILFGLSFGAFLVYWLIIREIKYYQVTKNTTYQITEKSIIFSQKFLGKEKITHLPIDQVKLFHLVKYNLEEGQKGTIFIYMNEEITAFDLVEKEQNNLPKIQLVSDFANAFKLLQRLKQSSKKLVA